MKHKLKLNVSIVLGGFLAAGILGLYFYIYAIPSISGSLAETVVLTYGELQTFNEADCLIVRSEKVFTAEESGKASYYIEESAKTRKGIKVLDVYSAGGKKGYRCPETGFVSYVCDGFESVLTPDRINEIDPEDFIGEEAKYAPDPKNIAVDYVSVGSPVYKLINSDTWHIAAFVPSEYEDRYEIGMGLTVRFEDGTEIPGSVCEIDKKGETFLAVISTKRWYSEFAKLRLEKAAIITKDSEGLIVPNTALAKEDGRDGVYVKGINGEYNFTRVKIIVSGESESLLCPEDFTEKNADGESVSVKSVSIYDEILRDSSKAGRMSSGSGDD